MRQEIPSPAALRALFERDAGATIGLEEELMLLDPETLELAPRAPEALELVGGDPRFKLEMPAAQFELLTPPCATVPAAAAELAAARRDLTAALAGRMRVAAAGTHPFSSGRGELNPHERYAEIEREYGEIAHRQLVFGLHVHVAVPGAERALAVYNGLRSHLPEIAALAANAPFYEGRDTGLASIRPKISELLPRQGVPPVIESWEAYAEALRWGAAAGGVADARRWWWELRLHPVHGTVEVRVPDAQATVADVAAVAALVHALVARLAARHDAGEPLPAAPTWRIEENRWAACRRGLDARLADLVTGEPVPARERLAALLGDLAGEAERLGCAAELRGARALVASGGAERQRALAAAHGLEGLTARLADAFAANVVSGAEAPG